MRILLALLLLVSVASAATNQVSFDLGVFTSDGVAYKPVRIRPSRQSFPRAEGSQVIGIDYGFKTTDATGKMTNAMVTGTYDIEFTNRFLMTTFQITTPATNCNCILTAAELTTSGTNLPSNLAAYSQTAADAMFAKRTNAIQKILTNGVQVGFGVTNLDFVSGVTGYVSGATVKLGVSAAGSGDVTTAQLNTASNRLWQVKADKTNGIHYGTTSFESAAGNNIEANGFSALDFHISLASTSTVSAPMKFNYGVTTNRVAIFNGNGFLTNSAGVDATELEYLDGVTSAIQTQLDGKAGNGVTNSFVKTTDDRGHTNTGAVRITGGLVVNSLAHSAGGNARDPNGNYYVTNSTGIDGGSGSSGPTTNAPPYTIAINGGLGSTNIVLDMLALGPTNVVRATLTANTGLIVTNVIDGMSVTLELIQDSTGNRGFTTNATWGFNVRFGIDVTGFAITTNASTKDLVRFLGSGTNALVVGNLRGFSL